MRSSVIVVRPEFHLIVYTRQHTAPEIYLTGLNQYLPLYYAARPVQCHLRTL